MKIVYRLVSYDKETQRKTGESAIPDENLAVVWKMAGILPTDDGMGDYPLKDDQANDIARLLNMKIDCDAFTYYVEPLMNAENNASGKSALVAKITESLEWLYDKAINGVPGLDRAEDLAAGYRDKSNSVEGAIKALIAWQVGKAGLAGFVTNLGGLITLPVAIPANVVSSLYIQLRLIAAIAHLRGYDLRNDQVRTLVIACLCGSATADILKDAGVMFGSKLVNRVVLRIPGAVLTKINQAIGFRLVTKAGTRGIVNISRLVPIVGGVVSGGFDAAATRFIGHAAAKLLIAVEYE